MERYTVYELMLFAGWGQDVNWYGSLYPVILSFWGKFDLVVIYEILLGSVWGELCIAEHRPLRWTEQTSYGRRKLVLTIGVLPFVMMKKQYRVPLRFTYFRLFAGGLEYLSLGIYLIPAWVPSITWGQGVRHAPSICSHPVTFMEKFSPAEAEAFLPCREIAAGSYPNIPYLENHFPHQLNTLFWHS